MTNTEIAISLKASYNQYVAQHNVVQHWQPGDIQRNVDQEQLPDVQEIPHERQPQHQPAELIWDNELSESDSNDDEGGEQQDELGDDRNRDEEGLNEQGGEQQDEHGDDINRDEEGLNVQGGQQNELGSEGDPDVRKITLSCF